MANQYYRLPLNLKDAMSLKELGKEDLRTSIAQNLHLMATTQLGESKFDANFGCTIWDVDFDNSVSDIELKEYLKVSLTESIKNNEKRITGVRLTVKIVLNEVDAVKNIKSIKKRVDIGIKAKLRSTNEVFNYYEYFYIGPLSYY